MILLLPTKEDVHRLELRPEDAAEVSEDWRVKVLDAIRCPGHWAGWHEGKLLGIGGVHYTPEALVPWLLCSRHVEGHKVALWRQARKVVSALRRSRSPVANYIPSNSPNKAFIERLGFSTQPDPARPGWDLFSLPHV